MTLIKTKIGILGLGAIGSTLSHQLLQKESNELFFFSRTEKSLLKIKTNEVKYETKIKVRISPPPLIKLDWLIICLKEHQFSEAHHWFTNLIHNKLKIVVIRNGLNLKEPIAAYTSLDNVLECTIDCPTTLNNNQFYESLYPPVLTTTPGKLTDEFSFLFNEIQIETTNDFKTACWKKLCESASLGSILCLSGETCWIFKHNTMKNLYIDVLNECILVAKADGATIEDRYVNEMLDKLKAYPESKTSSMLTDRQNKKIIELGAKNGIISKLGKKYNIETPINDLIVKLLTYTNARI